MSEKTTTEPGKKVLTPEEAEKAIEESLAQDEKYRQKYFDGRPGNPHSANVTNTGLKQGT